MKKIFPNRLFVITLCFITMIATFTTAFAGENIVSTKASSTSVKSGDTVTVTVAMKEQTVSSLGITLAESSDFTIVSGEWVKPGVIADYNASKKIGAYAAGSATAISGDVFKITLKVNNSASGKVSFSVTLLGKNGTTTVFQQTVAQEFTAACKTHTFGSWSKKDSNSHIQKCTACGYEEVEAHTYDNGGVAKQATCTADGARTYTCLDCGYVKTESIKALGHTYSGWTKSSDGKTHVRNCTRCLSDEQHESHKWDNGKVTKEATCQHDGTKLFTCTVCGATNTNAITQLAHTYSNDCDETCNVCNQIRTPKHKWSTTWSKDGVQHWHECTACHAKKDEAKHTISDWIVDKQASELSAGRRYKKCTGCGYISEDETIPATGCKHGKTKIANVSTATCYQEGYTGNTVCSTCGTVMKKGTILPKTEHVTEIANKRTATCIEEGYTGDKVCKNCKIILEQGSIIPHIEHEYVNGFCKFCGAESPNHSDDTKPAIDTTDPTTKPAEPITEPAESTTDTSEPVESTAESDSPTTTDSDDQSNADDGSSALPIILGVCGGAAVIGFIVFLIVKHKKKDDE